MCCVYQHFTEPCEDSMTSNDDLRVVVTTEEGSDGNGKTYLVSLSVPARVDSIVLISRVPLTPVTFTMKVRSDSETDFTSVPSNDNLEVF